MERVRKSVLFDIVFDNHMHLRTDGLFLAAVDQFIKAGGNAINLVNLPDYSISPNEYYRSVYINTIKIAEKVVKERDIRVLITIGPYPLDYFFFKEIGRNPVEELMKGIDIACDFISEGKADALGEVGRPHFVVEPEILGDSNRILEYGFERSKDAGNPIILHTNDLDAPAYAEIEEMARRSGVKMEKVVKHHAYPRDLKLNSPLRLSIPATRPNVRESLEISNDFMLETDYVDDPKKPGKVISPDSVPKRAKMIMNEYENWEEIFSSIFMKVPMQAFGADAFEIH